MRKKIAIILVCLFCCGGCASFGVWSSTAQTDITEFVAWANQWIGGAVAEAPAVISEASTLLGSSSKVVIDAKAALTVATAALAGLNTAAKTGGDVNTAQANVQAAIDGINQTVGAVQAVIAAAKPATTTR